MIYQNSNLKEIVFPLGGVGTGSIGLMGNGAFIDWEIFNRPAKGSLNHHSFFAVKAEYPGGRVVTKVLQGDWTKDLTGKYSQTRYQGFGFGPNNGTMCGFPHFKNVRFDGKFPIATLTFTDDGFPAKIIMRAFNPFIPLDADNSSLPAAFFDISICSREEDVKYTVILSVQNPFPHTWNYKRDHDRYTAVTLQHAGLTPADRDYGDLTVAVDCKAGIYQEYWYRGRWMDHVATFWHELETGTLKNRKYNTPGATKTSAVGTSSDACSVGAAAVVNKGRKHSFRFTISWNVPNFYNYWKPWLDENGRDIMWKNYYATRFEDSAASAFYCLDHWEQLYKKTKQFCTSIHASSLDKTVLDAVTSNLSVLKTPTTVRLEDGTFYGWEGSHEQAGSCEGTCTHVWSYVYSLCFLFPEFERSLRDTEFRYDTDEYGEMKYRTMLPLGRPKFARPPTLDGQMATIIKIYRDWKITGNDAWLRENWENTKRVLEYAWNDHNIYEWDRDYDGVLEGMQHHTLDMEVFGPSAWLQGMYLAALKAAVELAAYLGDTEKEKEYADLFQKGYQWTKENLFNGSYFIHKVDVEDKAYTEHFNCPEYWNEEKGQLKYQISEGCAIDQMLGQWHANICGLGDIFDKEQRKIALTSMMRNNFKASLRDMTNTWRTFAINDESGSVICVYPEGAKKPIIPVPYCEECMTGFEYAFAGLLVSEGLIEEGLQVVRAVRNRFDGIKRNPFNEFECGSNYSRSMASFALLPIFSGFTFDLPRKQIGFAPVLPGDFRCFWSLGTGWGDYFRTGCTHRIVLRSGSLTLSSVKLGKCGQVKAAFADGKQVDFTQNGEVISFNENLIRKELRLEA